MEYIRAHRVVSAADLSRALQMTEANARHHLNFLAAQGLIMVIGHRPVQGKGRPVRLFGLSELAIGNQLEGLAKALLTALLQNTTGTAREAKLEELARLLIGEDVRDTVWRGSSEWIVYPAGHPYGAAASSGSTPVE